MSNLNHPAHFYVLDPINTSSPPKKASYDDIMVGRIYALLPGLGRSSWVTVVEKTDKMFKIKGINEENQKKLNSLFGGMGGNILLGMKYSFDGITSLSKENFEKLTSDIQGFWIYAPPSAATSAPPVGPPRGGKRRAKKTRKASKKTRKASRKGTYRKRR